LTGLGSKEATVIRPRGAGSEFWLFLDGDSRVEMRNITLLIQRPDIQSFFGFEIGAHWKCPEVGIYLPYAAQLKLINVSIEVVGVVREAE
jgi:hypothetical protein